MDPSPQIVLGVKPVQTKQTAGQTGNPRTAAPVVRTNSRLRVFRFGSVFHQIARLALHDFTQLSDRLCCYGTVMPQPLKRLCVNSFVRQTVKGNMLFFHPFPHWVKRNSHGNPAFRVSSMISFIISPFFRFFILFCFPNRKTFSFPTFQPRSVPRRKSVVS